MTKKEITKIQTETKDLELTTTLLKQLQGYYFYYNWQSDQENKLHEYNCGHCSYGSGKRKDAEQGGNGVWIGPFATKEIANRIIKEKFNIAKVQHCRCLKSK